MSRILLPYPFYWVCALFLCAASSSYGQGWTVLGGDTLYEFVQQLEVGDTGEIVISGQCTQNITWPSQSFSNLPTFTGANDILAYLAKFDSLGQVVWLRSWMQGNPMPHFTQLSPDGSIYVGGDFVDSINIDGVGTAGAMAWRNYFLARFDSNGQLEWLKFSDFNGIYHNYLNDICVDTSSNILIAGYTNNDITLGNDTVAYGEFLAKFDPGGNLLWWRTEFADALYIDEDNNYYLQDGNEIKKYNEQNNLLNTYSFTGSSIDQFVVDYTGNLIVSIDESRVEVVDASGGSLGTYNYTAQAFFRLAVQDNGNWVLAYRENNFTHLAYFVGPAQFNGSCIVGYGIDSIPNVPSVYDAAFYSDRLHIGGRVFAENPIVFGEDTVQGYGNFDAYISRLVPSELPNSVYFASLNPTSLNAYPNPFHNQLTIELDSESYEDASVEIFNGQMQLVDRASLPSSGGKVELSHLDSGYYLFIIHQENQQYFIRIVKT